MRVEVLDGIERRQRWSRGEKIRSLTESLEPGATVAEVALRNDPAQARSVFLTAVSPSAG